MNDVRRRQAHALRFRGLADETRLRILELLRSGEHCVCELTEALEIGQSLLSFHLKTLREAGLVTQRREGRWAHYSLDEAGLAELSAGVARLARLPQRRRPRRCD